MKIVSLLLTICLVLFLYPKNVFATISLEISNLPTSVETGQEFSADVVFSCSGCGTSYLRGVFFSPESSTSYSGYTQNNALEWVNSGTPAGYFKIDSGSWSGQLKFKFDPEKSAGDYYFKLGRYTASGTSFSQVSGNSLITITSTPTPTASSTETPIVTQSPTSTPTSTKSKSLYKINKPKDENGQQLSSVKIYIDNLYTRHEDDEILEFCDSCFCDNDHLVSCGFGDHTIKLSKTGYADWSEQRTISQGINYETTPILTKLSESSPTPTTTSTPTQTSKPTKTSTPSPSVIARIVETKQSPTLGIGSESAVLGDSTNSASISADTFDLLITPSPEKKTKKPTNHKTLFFVGLGIAVSSGSLLYFRHRND